MRGTTRGDDEGASVMGCPIDEALRKEPRAADDNTAAGSQPSDSRLAPAVAAAGGSAAHALKLDELGRHLLAGVLEDLDEARGELGGLDGEEGQGGAFLAGAAAAADAVDVVFVGLGHVEVADNLDVLDVEAARGDVGGDEEGALAGAEVPEDPIALFLGLVAVDTASGEVVVLEGPGEGVAALLGLDEDDHLLEALVLE
eukprot:CAMPEP_0197427574 /NCGR_PEP_ID=MMETSP1170-20131217/38698_1 /TAXON_ID=54406 /ORGANISM="Sarcinochrysis sp, Strain CCMP770" /LENGTH=199 /DNA_ID=CAMNT_0042955269 /DNA_START=240 /DNA_END=837 /DNA_ORIENTATION=+